MVSGLAVISAGFLPICSNTPVDVSRSNFVCHGFKFQRLAIGQCNPPSDDGSTTGLGSGEQITLSQSDKDQYGHDCLRDVREVEKATESGIPFVHNPSSTLDFSQHASLSYHPGHRIIPHRKG